MITLDTDLNKTADRIFFDCISSSNKPGIIAEHKQQVPVLGYMLTEYPKYQNAFYFVYSSVSRDDMAFSKNQEALIYVASAMFKGAKPLGKVENEILNKTLDRLYRTSSSLPGRE